MSKTALWSIVAAAVVVVAVVLAVIFVPNNNNQNPNKGLSTAQKSAATNQIKSNFKAFFAVSTALQARENLLQNGSQFAQPMAAEFTQLNNEKPSVTINSVTLSSNKTAKVVYTVELNGQPVLSNQTGGALLINKTWKVSDVTLCQLFSLGGQKPSVCNNVH